MLSSFTAVVCLCLVGFQVSPAPQITLTADELFATDHIVEVKIDVPIADWDELRLQTRSFTRNLSKTPPPSPFEYCKANITIDGVLIKDVAIRKKGFLGSLDDDRPSLKVRFDKYVDQQPIAGLDRLTLNNNKQDMSCLSQHLGYRFFNQTGTFASRCNFAKVTVNGEYLGVYSNVESIRKPMLQRGFDDDSGALFEGTVCDFFPGFEDKFEQKNKAAKTAQMKQITKILHASKLDVDALGKLIDIPAFVKFWATESLLGFWDGYSNNQNNFFMYQKPSNGKFYFLPWGADALFQEGMPIPPYQISPRFVHNKAILSNELYRVPEVQAMYHETINGLLANHWKEYELIAEVDRLVTELKPHLRPDNTQFEPAVDSFRRFIKERRRLLEKEMKSGPIELASRASWPIYFEPNGSIAIDYQTQWYDRVPADTETLGEVKISLKLDDELVKFKQIGAYSEHSKWPPLPPDVPKPPTVIFKGFRASDGKEILIAVGLPIEKFVPTKEPIALDGMMFIGPVFQPGTETRMLNGQATFESASMKDGSPVIGSLKLSTVVMRGGKPLDNK